MASPFFATNAANRADSIALYVGGITLASAFFPLPEWAYVALIVANVGGGVYLGITWHLAASQRPVDQLPRSQRNTNTLPPVRTITNTFGGAPLIDSMRP